MRRRERPLHMRALDRLIKAGWGDVAQELIPDEIRRTAQNRVPEPPGPPWKGVAFLCRNGRIQQARRYLERSLSTAQPKAGTPVIAAEQQASTLGADQSVEEHATEMRQRNAGRIRQRAALRDRWATGRMPPPPACSVEHMREMARRSLAVRRPKREYLRQWRAANRFSPPPPAPAPPALPPPPPAAPPPLKSCFLLAAPAAPGPSVPGPGGVGDPVSLFSPVPTCGSLGSGEHGQVHAQRSSDPQRALRF